MDGGHIVFFCFLFIYICRQRTECCRTWDEKHLQCKECYPGYLGWNCSEQCRYPNYGRDCQELCKCEEKLCDIANGCIAPDKTNCPPGYLGRNCSERCPYPNYGIDCQNMCGCEEKLCDVATGCISPADEADCPSGYQGHNCSKQCHYPNYGKHCHGFCECEEKSCDIANGCFSPDEGCIDGYFGEGCKKSCQYPSYGKDCQQLCECVESACNFTTGCDTLSHNDLKSEESHESMVKQITGHTLLAVIVSVSVLSSVLMSAIISLVIWRLKRPNRTIMRASSPVQEQQTSNKATTLGAANTYCFNDDARLSHFYSSPIELSTSLNNPE
ncbi:cell death abnormality protein 1-like [Magallana gigas]|uniref:cell death abnormality protein 1-like n=1 Tax=Magallana gigas TaxID=29159 RepID=UPI00333F5596